MGSTDSIPIVSQIKSLIQVISGDKEGAKRTQEHFLHTFPVLSQITSAVQAIEGDSEGAKETQEEFAESLGHFADGIPVLGHIKGAIEYATGNKAAGDASMKAASRTLGVIAGGAAGFFAGGPAGAFLGGIAAGAAMDGIITGVDSAVHHKYTPYGEVSVVTNMVNGHYDPGEEFDFVAGIGFDGLAGLGEAGEGSLTQLTSEHFTGKPIYRVMNDEAGNKAIADQAIPLPHKGSEVWIAESTEHSRGFISGDAGNRSSVVEINIDKEWYTKMREDNLVHQTEANLLENKGKNVWNDEAGGAGAGATGNKPGHGAVNIGVKHVQHNKLWGGGKNGGGFSAFTKKLQTFREALEKDLSVGDHQVSPEFKQALFPIFGSKETILIVDAGTKLAKGLRDDFPYLQSATDAANKIEIQLDPFHEMAERLKPTKNQVSVKETDIIHVKALLETIDKTVNDVRGNDNLAALNSHVKSMRLINPMSWRYKYGDMFKNWTAKHPEIYGSAVISSWGLDNPQTEVRKKTKYIEESLQSDYTLANTTQGYEAPANIVINGRTNAKGPLMDKAITVGGLPVTRIQVECIVKIQEASNVQNKKADLDGRLYLRLRKHDCQINEFHDIDICGSINSTTERQISFDNSSVGLEYIGLGGSIELWCIVGTGKELTCKNLSCRITYGAPQFRFEKSGDSSQIIFSPTRNVSLDDNSGQKITLYTERIPLGVATIKGIHVSFEAKDQDWGEKNGEVYLRIWHNETMEADFTDYSLTSGVMVHKGWKTFNWDLQQNQSIPIGAVAQLMCRVGWGGGHTLHVRNLMLNIAMGRPQMETLTTIDFERIELVEKFADSDWDYIDLYDDVVLISHDLKSVQVKFDAKDQGWGNQKGRLAMFVIKPSGERKTILFHDAYCFIDHEWTSYEYNSGKELPFTIETGDKVKFMCGVGNRKYHHKLYVKNFYAVLTFHETTRVFAPSQSVNNTNNSESLVPLYVQRFPCGVSAVTKVKVQFEAKDQGHGNLKGKIYIRVFENGCKQVISDVLITKVTHSWSNYTYESDSIGEKIPPGSVIQFMTVVGGGGSHSMHVRNFVANITFIDSPRNETVTAFNEEIRCLAKLKQLNATGATSNVVVNVLKPNGSIRTTFPLESTIHKSALISRVAIGDKLRFVSKTSGSHGSFQVTASFLPLETPNHSSVVIHFAPKLDFYGFVHGYAPENILTGDDHRLELKQKLRAVTVGCTWTDDNPDSPSTGKLFLVLRAKEGTEKGRYDVFGTVKHDWNHVMRVFASGDDIVRNAQPGDHILLLREVGQNGVLRIDDLDMVLILST
ncbi:uncharacterized protein [Antedon mediterranea]|uniref:uncharacterized protein isoform X1 n=1 Tax=Antedon mediterranea TaxID=105859 RepID=UPI003AF99015